MNVKWLAVPVVVASIGLTGCHVQESTGRPYSGRNAVYVTTGPGYRVPYYWNNDYGWWGTREWHGYRSYYRYEPRDRVYYKHPKARYRYGMRRVR